MSNLQEVDKLLKHLYMVDETIDRNNVYMSIINKGDRVNCFSQWKNYFKTKANIYCSEVDYFLILNNKDDKVLDCLDQIKLYIPLDKEHINAGAKLIFDFLAQNDIPHLSKIAVYIRRDNIVIRMNDKNAAMRLIDYVNSSDYLMEGLLKPIPFTFQYKGIGLAVDGTFSYNSTVADLVASYINEKKEAKENVDVYSFKNWLMKKYNLTFTAPFYNMFDEFLRVKTLPQAKTLNIGHQLYMLENIMQLMILSLSSNNINDFFSHYDRCCDIKKYKDITTMYDNLSCLYDFDYDKYVLESPKSIFPKTGYVLDEEKPKEDNRYFDKEAELERIMKLILNESDDLSENLEARYR